MKSGSEIQKDITEKKHDYRHTLIMPIGVSLIGGGLLAILVSQYFLSLINKIINHIFNILAAIDASYESLNPAIKSIIIIYIIVLHLFAAGLLIKRIIKTIIKNIKKYDNIWFKKISNFQIYTNYGFLFWFVYKNILKSDINDSDDYKHIRDDFQSIYELKYLSETKVLTIENKEQDNLLFSLGHDKWGYLKYKYDTMNEKIKRLLIGFYNDDFYSTYSAMTANNNKLLITKKIKNIINIKRAQVCAPVISIIILFIILFSMSTTNSNTSVKEVVVSSDKSGDYLNLNDAVNREKSKNLIIKLKESGINDSITVDNGRDITVKAYNSKSRPVISNEGNTANFIVKNGKLTIENIEIQGNSKNEVNKKFSSIIVEKGILKIKKSKLHFNKGINIAAKGDDVKVSIEKSELLNSKYGVYIANKSMWEITDCEIYGNQYSGISAENGATITIRDCKLYKNGSNGVYISGDVKLNMNNTRIFNNYGGIWAERIVKSIINNCAISNNCAYAFNIRECDDVGILESSIGNMADEKNIKQNSMRDIGDNVSISNCTISNTSVVPFYFQRIKHLHMKGCDINIYPLHYVINIVGSSGYFDKLTCNKGSINGDMMKKLIFGIDAQTNINGIIGQIGPQSSTLHWVEENCSKIAKKINTVNSDRIRIVGYMKDNSDSDSYQRYILHKYITEYFSNECKEVFLRTIKSRDIKINKVIEARGDGLLGRGIAEKKIAHGFIYNDRVYFDATDIIR